MSTVAGWGWRKRIRHRHFLHLWYLRLDDWNLECTCCRAIKRDRARHLTNKEKSVSKFLTVAARVSKAIAAALAAGVAAFSAATVAGSVGMAEWLTIGVAVVGAFLVAYNAPANAPS